MSSEIATLPQAGAIRRNPELMKPIQNALRKIIATAAALERWQEVEQATDALIEYQKEFVAWWQAEVDRPGNPQLLQSTATIEVREATRQTGFNKWQVSRWNTALDDVVTYRRHQISAARRKAALEAGRADPSAQRGQPDRNGPDFWPTPDSLIYAAREHMVPFLPPGRLWECACGDGRLGRGIAAEIMTDKYPQDSSIPLDFLTDDPPADDLIAFTNQPFNAAAEFLTRGLELFDAGAIRGLVLLLRHDHFMAGGKVEALNRAVFEVHCNWRPLWIPDTVANPRWAFAWVYWGEGERRPPLYVTEEQ
jgi:hypothetical protein